MGCDVLYRKKAKTSKSAATEVVSDNLHSSSIDKNDQPESDRLGNETENDVPMSQCRPMLLSQTGKFIPKFMAKKKLSDCVVKIECASKLAASANCSVAVSETEIGVESQPLGTSSVVGEMISSAFAYSVAATDARNDNESVLVSDSDSVLVECVAVTNTRDASNSEQPKLLPDNGLAETIDTNHGSPVDTALQVEDIGIGDRSDCDGCTSVEEKGNSALNGGDLLGETHHCISTEEHDVNDATKSLSLPSSNNVSSEAAAHAAPLVDEDCTEPTAPQIAGHENGQRAVDIDESVDGSKAVTNDNNTMAVVQSELNTSTEDASGHTNSIPVVADICSDISSMPEMTYNDTEALPDVVSNEDSGRKVVMNEVTESNIETLHATISKSHSSGLNSEVCANSKTEADHFDCVPVNSVAAEDHEVETGDDMDINRVTEVSESSTGSNEPPLFDDFLDLTDSQLCQLDDVSRFML